MTIEERTIAYLNSVLDVPVYGAEPNDNAYPGTSGRPMFCVVGKAGGGESNMIRSATVTVQSYANTLAEASNLNETVVEKMKGMIIRDDVTKVRLNSDYEFTKESTKQPRYQAVFDITYY